MIKKTCQIFLIINLLMFTLINVAIANERKLLNINMGAGIGIPYGIFGFNAGINFYDIVEVSACFGTTFLAGSAKCQIASLSIPVSDKLTPRISIINGTYGVLGSENLTTGESDWESFEGKSLGIGFIAGNKKGRGTFDIIYVLDNDFFDAADRLEKSGYKVENSNLIGLERIKLSVGYRYVFF